MMVARPNRLLHKYFAHWVNVLFLPSQFLFHPHTQTRKVRFLGLQINIPNLELFPNRVLSRIAFSIIALLKDDSTDFTQEERLGLPYWTMIWAIFVFVDVSKYLDIWTSEFLEQ